MPRVSRREFLKTIGLSGAALSFLGRPSGAWGQVPAASSPVQKEAGRLFGVELRKAIDLHSLTGCATVRGFNYQPTWGHDGRTVWGKFDPVRYRYELQRGKDLFPAFNTVRLWLSWTAFKEKPEATKAAVAKAIEICGDLNLLIVPTLFMRWIGHPVFDPVRFADMETTEYEARFGPFLDAVVTPQKGNPYLLAWDLCNEPTENPDQLVAYDESQFEFQHVMKVQHDWLRAIRDGIKRRDPQALTCVGMITMKQDLQTKERFESLSDIITPHFYEIHCEIYRNGKPGKLEDLFDDRIRAFMEDLRTRGVRKPVLATEAFWGAVDDRKRAAYIGPSARTFRKYGVGYLPYGLWESPVADLHSAKFGPVTSAGNLCFINMDGTLRAGHEAFNDE